LRRDPYGWISSASKLESRQELTGSRLTEEAARIDVPETGSGYPSTRGLGCQCVGRGRGIQLRTVEGVEEYHAERQAHPLADLKLPAEIELFIGLALTSGSRW